MSAQPNSDRPIENLLAGVVVTALIVAAGGNWLIGNLASLLGRQQLLNADLGEALSALSRMPDHWGDPRRAWTEPAASNLPGPVLYWTSAVMVIVVLLVVGVAVLVRMGRRHEPVDQRRRAGVETQARLAKTADLRRLLTRKPKAGRFVLARWTGSRPLSTEGDLYRGRRGVRGAVGVFGPSQSGKTTGLIAGVDAWTGPAIVSSVKTDLLRATIAQRSDVGKVKVFDPAGISGINTATWTPLRAAGRLTGAVAAAQMLARSGARGETNHQFWGPPGMNVGLLTYPGSLGSA